MNVSHQNVGLSFKPCLVFLITAWGECYKKVTAVSQYDSVFTTANHSHPNQIFGGKAWSLTERSPLQDSALMFGSYPECEWQLQTL
jgi:hypothetical protein